MSGACLEFISAHIHVQFVQQQMAAHPDHYLSSPKMPDIRPEEPRVRADEFLHYFQFHENVTTLMCLNLITNLHSSQDSSCGCGDGMNSCFSACSWVLSESPLPHFWAALCKSQHRVGVHLEKHKTLRSRYGLRCRILSFRIQAGDFRILVLMSTDVS